jgi:uncharacterized protein YjiK
MRYLQFSFLLICVGFAISCISVSKKPQEQISYDLNHPAETIVLPDTLREISGLTCIDSVTLACVQDENGVLFLYDLQKNDILNSIQFHLDGDYEGLAKVDNDMYILRSDGAVFEISNYAATNFITTTHQTQIPAPNNEGFCYDKGNNRLLIGCKGKLGKGPEMKDLRAIYGFDLETKTISEKPVFEFNVSDIKKYVEENKIPVPKKEKTNSKSSKHKEEPNIKFMISALAIHPKTKELYILSAADHLLFVYDDKNVLKHIEPLDQKIFNKAEGITFMEDGSLYVSNEAQEKKPTLLKFNYNSIKK